MPARHVEEQLDRLSLLRDADPAEAIPALRKALGDRVNLVAAKAARITAARELRELTPDLLRAFDRLFANAAERDPQCWGKLAIAIALKDLGHDESAPFLRGMRHIQMEPSFGGATDTAETLRGTCLLALPACGDLERDETLRCFVDALAEKSHAIRKEAVRALRQMGGAEVALVLRLKARLGDKEPEVTGQVFDALLELEGDRAVPLLAEFMQKPESGVREEAALALGASRLPQACELLKESYAATRDPQFREVLLRAVAMTRQERAIEWLLGLVRMARKREALDALTALALLRGSDEIRQRAASAVHGREPELEAEYRKLFS